MVQKQLSSRAWAELGLLALIWGAVFLSVRLTLNELPPLTAVWHRVFWAAIVLWGVVLWRGDSVPRGRGFWGAALVMGLLNNALPFTLIAWAQLHIPSGLAAIFNASTALFGVVFAALVFADERLSLRRGLGVGIGFAGVVLAIGPGALHALDVTSWAQMAVVAGTMCYALASLWGRLRLQGVAPTVSAAGMLTGAAFWIAPVALMVDGVPRLDLSLMTWAALGYTSVIATALAYLLYFRVLAAAGSGNLMLVTLLIPPVAIWLGAAVRDESLPLSAYLGFALLAIGLIVLDGRVLRRWRKTV